MTKSRVALLVALGIDNFGSGLFLPLSLVFVTQVMGLPLAQAGSAMTVGTLAGVAVPAVAAAWVDRIGARPVVIGGQLLQLAGSVTYLLAHGVLLVVVAAVLRSAGLQLFYSAVFTLIAETAGEGPTDHAFTMAGMVRGATFGAGALTVGGLLSGLGPIAYTLAIAMDAASYVLAALSLTYWLHTPAPRPAAPPSIEEAGRSPRSSVLRDGPYLGLIAVTLLFAVDTDFFLVGMPVYALDVLHTPAWLPGAILALLTVLTTLAATVVMRMTRRLSRPGAMITASLIVTAWCAASAAALLLPAGLRPIYLLGGTLLIAAANLVRAGRANALAEAAAPAHARGRYLAAFQYAFTVAGILAPAVVTLFSVTAWLPWLLIALLAVLGIPALRWITHRLPAHAMQTNPPLPAEDTPP